MEQKIFNKINLYDQIGYLMVGSIAILVLYFDLIYFYHLELPEITVNNFIVWFIIAYFIGHLIQGIANIVNKIPILNILIKEKKTDFSKNEKEILEKAEKYFEIEGQDHNKLWNLCYLFATSKDITGQIQAFNSYYSLYRGWLVIFFINSLFITVFLFINFQIISLLLLGFNLLLLFIFYQRSRSFWSYLRNKVLQTFILLYSGKL